MNTNAEATATNRAAAVADQAAQGISYFNLTAYVTANSFVRARVIASKQAKCAGDGAVPPAHRSGPAVQFVSRN